MYIVLSPMLAIQNRYCIVWVKERYFLVAKLLYNLLCLSVRQSVSPQRYGGDEIYSASMKASPLLNNIPMIIEHI